MNEKVLMSTLENGDIFVLDGAVYQVTCKIDRELKVVCASDEEFGRTSFVIMDEVYVDKVGVPKVEKPLIMCGEDGFIYHAINASLAVSLFVNTTTEIVVVTGDGSDVTVENVNDILDAINEGYILCLPVDTLSNYRLC